MTLCYKLTLRSNLTPTPTYYNRKSTETYRRRFCWRMSDKCILTALLYSGLFVRKHNVGRTGLPYKDVCMRDMKNFSIGLENGKSFQIIASNGAPSSTSCSVKANKEMAFCFFFTFVCFCVYCIVFVLMFL